MPLDDGNFRSTMSGSLDTDVVAKGRGDSYRGVGLADKYDSRNGDCIPYYLVSTFVWYARSSVRPH